MNIPELFDTHTHLYLDEFAGDRQDVMQRAFDAGITRMMFPNVDLTTIDQMKSLHAAYPGSTYMAMGLHPTEVNQNWKHDLSLIEHELNSGTDYRAIGEVGVDLYWDKTYRNEQIETLDAQLDFAEKMNLPVIIHCREALKEIIDILDSRKGRIPQLIFHSFGGTADDVTAIRRRTDAYFGINGIVTFKNSRLREVLPVIGTERMLLETDAPYLAPVPYRGRRNETSYIINTAQHIASVLNLPLEEVAVLTTTNARQLFRIIK